MISKPKNRELRNTSWIMAIPFIFLPKFHCALSYIEMFWGCVKRYAREICDYSFKSLQKVEKPALDSVPLDHIRRYTRKSCRYMDIYQTGAPGSFAPKRWKKI
jgi:hypothetical protein